MKRMILGMTVLGLLAGCTPPEPPEPPQETAPEPVPLSVPLATG